MVPTPAPDPFEETYLFIGYGYTLTYVYSYPEYNTYDPYNGYNYSYFNNVRKTAFAVWAVAVGLSHRTFDEPLPCPSLPISLLPAPALLLLCHCSVVALLLLT